MIGLLSVLSAEIIYEAVKFVVMILLLVVAVFVGSKLRSNSDMKKKKSQLNESVSEKIQ